MYPEKIAVAQIVEIIKAKGITDVVISPGSRNAPFIIAFSKDPSFNCFSVIDERSAAFFAIGRAIKTKNPVIVLCTSGSALLNYYPAVAEAFYQEIPLLVLSADRPSSWTDQGNGQTIRQHEALTSHTVKSISVDGDSSSKEGLWHVQREVNFALNSLLEKPNGPVHLNVYLNEPLYDQVIEKHPSPKIIHRIESKTMLSQDDIGDLRKQWNRFEKKMILLGQGFPEEKLTQLMQQLSADDSVVVLTESLSNMPNDRYFSCIDKLILLDEKDLSELEPQLLVTIGGAVVSKKIKDLLRDWNLEAHWNIGIKQVQQDTYQQLTLEIPLNPVDVIEQLMEGVEVKQSNYYAHFDHIRNAKEQIHAAYIAECSYSDLSVFSSIFNQLKKGTTIHLSNSSIVRYAQLFEHGDKFIFHANRGTSGIDGSGSTAIGYASASSAENVLITGDISFFYDSNALWNNEALSNFKIVLINNSGGGIFRIIPGPDTSGALETFFETEHQLNAESLANMHGYDYLSARDQNSVENGLQSFLNTPGKGIFEIFTPKENNDKTLKGLFNSMKTY